MLKGMLTNRLIQVKMRGSFLESYASQHFETIKIQDLKAEIFAEEIGDLRSLRRVD